jgi:hypothetical protein
VERERGREGERGAGRFVQSKCSAGGDASLGIGAVLERESARALERERSFIDNH